MKMIKSVICLAGLTLLVGCDTVKETLGLHRSQPDEFNVVDRHPLTTPPGYGLRPPANGQDSPAIIDPHAQAQQSILGPRVKANQSVQQRQKATKGEQALLDNLPKGSGRQNIREIIANEQKNSQSNVQDHMKSLSKTYKGDSEVIDPHSEYKKHAGQTHPTQLIDKEKSQITNVDLVDPEIVDEKPDEDALYNYEINRLNQTN